MYGSRSEQNYLFSTRDGDAVMRAQIEAACSEADKLPEQRLLGTDLEALIEYFVEKYSVLIPTIDRDGVEASHHERQYAAYDQWEQRSVMVPGEAYDFEVPYEGDKEVFALRPNVWDLSPPVADVTDRTLRFTISGRTLDPAAVKQQVDSLLGAIDTYLDRHRSMWAPFPEQLRRQVRQRIDDRRARLLQQKSSAAALAGLGIKIKEKAGDARTFVPPGVKQRVQPQLPPMRPAAPPEPTLDQGVYENILGLIRGAGRSIEQSSSRTRALDEETLRDMFLVPLNAHFVRRERPSTSTVRPTS